MKKIIMNSAIFIMSVFISGVVILTAGCDNNKPKIQKDTPFAFIPYECKVIGKVNVASILKIEVVSKNIDDNKDLPYAKELKAAGLEISNIESIVFGIELPASLKDTTATTYPTSDGVIIISAKSKINVDDFIKIAEKSSEGVKFKVEKIEDKTAYILPAAKNNTETYIVQLNDKLIAVGTQKDATKAVELINNKGISILEDEQLMKLSKNTEMPDMLWLATLIPDGFISKMDKDTPNIKDGVISINHVNNCLKISGVVNCATKEDAQKVLLPFQMASTLIAMTSDNAVKPEDLSIKADNAALFIDINLTEKGLMALLAKSSGKPESSESKKHLKKDADISKEDVLKTSQELPETAENIVDADNTAE